MRSTVQINWRKVKKNRSVKFHQEKSLMANGRIDQNDEEFGSAIRHLLSLISYSRGLAKSDEVFSITNEHRRWLMGQ